MPSCPHPDSDTFVQQPNTARWSPRSAESPRADLSCQGHHGTFSGRVFHIRLPSVRLRISALMQRGFLPLFLPSPLQHVPIVIVGTKSDLTEERQVQREALMQLSAMWGTCLSTLSRSIRLDLRCPIGCPAAVPLLLLPFPPSTLD